MDWPGRAGLPELERVGRERRGGSGGGGGGADGATAPRRGQATAGHGRL